MVCFPAPDRAPPDRAKPPGPSRSTMSTAFSDRDDGLVRAFFPRHQFLIMHSGPRLIQGDTKTYLRKIGVFTAPAPRHFVRLIGKTRRCASDRCRMDSCEKTGRQCRPRRTARGSDFQKYLKPAPGC